MKKLMKNIFLKLMLHELHNDFQFLLERIKIEKVEKLAANLHDASERIIQIRNLDIH